jgi:hypothetical protein
MLYQDDKEKFISYWSKVFRISKKEFEETCIRESDNLLDNDEFAKVYGA